MLYPLTMKINHFICAVSFLAIASTSTLEAKGFLSSKDLPVSKNVYQNILPHKAIYEIELESAKSGSQILDISGKMYYGWEASCEGWETDHRFNIVYEYADTPPVEVKSDFTTLEDYAGKTLDFSSRRKRNEKLFEEFRGQASVSEDKIGGAKYSIPQDLDHDLTPGTLLPVAHTLKMIENAKSNARFFNAVIFDGSDEKGGYEVNAFIGKPFSKADVERTENIDTSLLESQLWPLRLAFFPQNQKTAQPEYEMQLNLHESGIVSSMTIAYEDFAVKQKLIALEALNFPECE